MSGELKQIGPGMYVADGDLHIDTPELARHLQIPVEAITDELVEEAVRAAFAKLHPEVDSSNPEFVVQHDAGSWRQ